MASRSLRGLSQQEPGPALATRLSGSLLSSSSGRPVTSAAVAVYIADPRDPPDEDDAARLGTYAFLHGVAHPDAEGAFSLPAADGLAGGLRLVATAAGCAPLQRLVAAGERGPVVLALDPGVAVEGRVVDKFGPRPDLRIEIVQGDLTLATTPGPDGRFEFAGVSPGPGLLRVSDDEGWLLTYHRVDPREGPLEVWVVARPARRLTVRTVDPAGAPVASEVKLRGSSVVYEAAEETGVHEFEDLPVEQTFTVLARRQDEVGPCPDQIAERVEVPALLPGEEREVVVRLEAGRAGAIEALVTDGAGRPLAGADLRFQRKIVPEVDVGGYCEAGARVDPEGRARLAGLAPGFYEVTGLGARAPVGVQVEAGATAHVTLVADGCSRRVAGRVVGPDGEPAAGATVHFAPWSEGAYREVETTTGEDGHFALLGLPDRLHPDDRLSIGGDGLATAEIALAAEPRQDDLHVRLEPRKPAIYFPGVDERESVPVLVRVRAPEGAGGAEGGREAWIGWQPDGGDVAWRVDVSLCTGGDERNVPVAEGVPGRFVAWKRGFLPAYGPPIVPREGMTVDIDFPFDAGGSFVGIVVDPEGRTVEDLSATLADGADASTFMPVVQDGRFEVRGMPPGAEVEVRLAARGFAPRVVTLRESEGPLRIVLEERLR